MVASCSVVYDRSRRTRFLVSLGVAPAKETNKESVPESEPATRYPFRDRSGLPRSGPDDPMNSCPKCLRSSFGAVSFASNRFKRNRSLPSIFSATLR